MPDALRVTHRPLMSRALRRVLLAVLVVGFVAGAAWVWRTGGVSVDGVRAWIASLGPAAPLLYVGAFVAGGLVGLPGMAFVLAARLAFGPWSGGALAYVAGMCSVTVPFVAARVLRRPAATPWQPRQAWLARALAQLATHPLRTVIVLRLVLWFNPPLSYALALARVPLRVYLVGCALALAPVVATAMVASSWFL